MKTYLEWAEGAQLPVETASQLDGLFEATKEALTNQDFSNIAIIEDGTTRILALLAFAWKALEPNNKEARLQQFISRVSAGIIAYQQPIAEEMKK